MLFNPYANQTENTEYEFVEQTLPDENYEVLLEKSPELTNADIPSLLYWLRVRVKTVLEPLYKFVGMLEGYLGGKKAGYVYQFKSGVHSVKEIDTIGKFFSRHTHIPQYMITDAILFYFFSGEAAEKEVSVATPEFRQTVVDLMDNKPGRKTPFQEEDASFEDLGALVAVVDDEYLSNGPERTEIVQLWNAVLGDVTAGVLILAKEELNESCGKQFTLFGLINSDNIRGQFARFVASKLSDGRNNAAYDNNGQAVKAQYARYIVTPSYKQMAAKAKWGIGAKLWFRNVYSRLVSDEKRMTLLQQLRQRLGFVFDRMEEQPGNVDLRIAALRIMRQITQIHDLGVTRQILYKGR